MPGPNEEIAVPSAPAAPVDPVVALQPAPAPQATETAAPAQADQAPATTAPAAAVTPPDPAAGAEAAPTHPPTLFDKPADKAPDKPAEEKPAEPPKVEAKPEEKPAPDKVDPEAPATEEAAPEPAPAVLEPIDYFAADGGLVIPETLKLDDAMRGEVATVFEAFRADPKKGAQALLDLHAKQMGEFAKHVESEQWRVFREMGENEFKRIMADPVLGGAGHDTAMAKVFGVRDIVVSDAKPGTERYQRELDEFNTAMRISGAGNMLPIVRAFYNASKFVREASPPPPNALPPKDIGKAPGQKGKLTYDKTNYT